MAAVACHKPRGSDPGAHVCASVVVLMTWQDEGDDEGSLSVPLETVVTDEDGALQVRRGCR